MIITVKRVILSFFSALGKPSSYSIQMVSSLRAHIPTYQACLTVVCPAVAQVWQWFCAWDASGA
jgi:hypothetical protein